MSSSALHILGLDSLKRKFKELSDSEITSVLKECVLKECDYDVLEAAPKLQKVEYEKLKKIVEDMRNKYENETLLSGIRSPHILIPPIKQNEKELQAKESSDEDLSINDLGEEEVGKIEPINEKSNNDDILHKKLKFYKSDYSASEVGLVQQPDDDTEFSDERPWMIYFATEKELMEERKETLLHLRKEFPSQCGVLIDEYANGVLAPLKLKFNRLLNRKQIWTLDEVKVISESAKEAKTLLLFEEQDELVSHMADMDGFIVEYEGKGTAEQVTEDDAADNTEDDADSTDDEADLVERTREMVEYWVQNSNYIDLDFYQAVMDARLPRTK